tara:strand:- start:189 stop:464 length:276 start_codon:yes stop_codon:yes gene_type:complete
MKDGKQIAGFMYLEDAALFLMNKGEPFKPNGLVVKCGGSSGFVVLSDRIIKRAKWHRSSAGLSPKHVWRFNLITMIQDKIDERYKKRGSNV